MSASPKKEVKSLPGFSRSLAFIIGIDNYTDVAPLNTAVNDAKQLAEILQKHHHFEIAALLPDARGKQLRNLIEKTLPETVTEKDRVFFYFAGHGIAADGDDGPAGYIIPADAKADDTGTFIPMQLLHETLNNLPCRHLMLVLDCCFSGAFQWSSKFRALGNISPKKLYKERFDRFVREPAWQVLTSAAYDQKALDVLSGKATGDRGKVAEIKAKEYATWKGNAHSPFAIALFEGLCGDADVNPPSRQGDGVITATELYAYVRDRVEPDTIDEKHRQTPGFFPLQKHDKGEYVFLHPRHPLNLPSIPKRNPYMGLQAFDEDDAELFYGRDRVIEALRARALGKYMLTVKNIQQLRSAGLPEGITNLLLRINNLGFFNENDFQEQLVALLGEADTRKYREKIFKAAQVSGNRLIVVSAVSGAGKSSVIKAGLLPTLREEDWEILPVVRPGEHPLQALQKTLLGTGYRELGPTASTASDLQAAMPPTYSEVKPSDLQAAMPPTYSEVKPSDLQAAMPPTYSEVKPSDLQAAMPPTYSEVKPSDLRGRKVALLIDQYEELLTRSKDDRAVEAFQKLLHDLLEKAPPESLLILITVRSDFEPQLDKGILADHWQSGRCTVPWFTVEELREVIVLPTEQEVMLFDPPELVDEIIEEVLQSPGALPLLSYTLSELFLAYKNSGREDRALKREDYEKLGGVMGALRTRADNLYQSLQSDAERKTMRDILLRMVSLEGGEPAGRRVPMVDLEYANADKNKRRGKIIEELAKTRLVVMGEGFVEPAHDALVRAWGTLSKWVGQVGEENMIVRGKVNAAAIDYHHNPTPKLLWNNHPRLPDLQQELKNADSWLNRKEMDFIEKSVQRKKSQTRTLWSTVALVMIALAGLAVWALFNAGEAQHQLLQANYNLARIFEGEATRYLGAAERGENVTQNYQQAWLYTLEALNLEISDSNYLPISVGRLQDRKLRRQIWPQLWNTRRGENHPVWSCRFSPDGNFIAGGFEDGTVRLWNAQNGSEITMLRGHSEGIESISFSPNGKYLASGSADFLAHIWDVRNAESRFHLRGHSEYVRSVAFTSDNKYLATGSDDRTIRLWQVNDGKLLVMLKGHVDFVNTIAFSPGDSLLASGSDDTSIRLWDITAALKKASDSDNTPNMSSHITVQAIKKLNSSESMVARIIFSPDGKYIIAARANFELDNVKTKPIEIWDIASTKVVAELSGHSKDVTCLALNPDARLLASGSQDTTIRFWDFAAIQDSIAAADGRLVVVDKALAIWQTRNNIVESIDFHPAGDRLITSGRNRYAVRHWQFDKKKIPESLSSPIDLNQGVSGHTDEVLAVAASSDGRLIASGSADRSVRIWDAADGRQIQIFQEQAAAINTIAFSSNNRLLAVGAADGSLRIWDLNSRKEVDVDNQINREELHSAFGQEVWNNRGFPFVDIVSCGGFLISSSYQGLELANNRNEFLFEHSLSHPDWLINEPALLYLDSPETRFPRLASHPSEPVVAVSYLNHLKFFQIVSDERNVPQLRLAHSAEMPYTYANMITFSPDGRKLAAATSVVHSQMNDQSQEQLLYIWRIPSFSAKADSMIKIHRYNHMDARITSLTFSADNKFIITGGADNTVRSWAADEPGDVGTAGDAKVVFDGDSISKSIYSQDGRLVILGTKGGDILIRHSDQDRDILKLSGHETGIERLKLSSNDRYLAVTTTAGDDFIWDLPGALNSKLNKHTAAQSEFLFLSGENYYQACLNASPDWKYYVQAEDSVLVIKRLKDHKAVARFISHIDYVTCFDFSPDGRYLVSGSADYTAMVWDFSEATAVFSKPLNGSSGATTDTSARIENVSQPLHQLSGQIDGIKWVRFSPNSKLIATASDDRTIRIWPLESNQSLYILDGNTREIGYISFSPDSRYLASAHYDNTVLLWDLTNGKLVARFNNHLGEIPLISSISFPRDGTHLTSSSEYYRGENNFQIIDLIDEYLNSRSASPIFHHLYQQSFKLLSYEIDQFHLKKVPRKIHLPLSDSTLHQEIYDRPRPAGMDPVDWLLQMKE